MRNLEIILVGLLLLNLVSASLPRSSAFAPSVAAFAPIVAVVSLFLALLALGLHLRFEGAHWQMLPAYLAFVPSGILTWHVYRASGPLLLSCVACALLLALCCVLSWALPMFKLPAPTGRYAVGTTIVYLVDNSRIEDAAPASGRKRELMVQLWYPAQPGHGSVARYRRRLETTLLSSYQAVLPTNSWLDAPIDRAGAPYPVLIYNHSWDGRRTQSTYLTEELASHGYVVASIDHPYNAASVAFPDGRVIRSIAQPAIGQLIDTTPQEVEQIGNAEADKQALDVRFVLDQLTRMNNQQGSPWCQTMDPAHTGVLGHSIGGAVAVQAWATDARIHAALNIDGWTFGTQAAKAARAVNEKSVSSPLLFLYEEGYDATRTPEQPRPAIWTRDAIESAVDDWDHEHVLLLLHRYGGFWLVLKGAIHPTFTDQPLSSPIARWSGRGRIAPGRAQFIVRACAVQFFDQALKGQPSALLNAASSQYPELVQQLHIPSPAGAPTP